MYVNPRLQKEELLKIYASNYFDNTQVGYYHYTENKGLRKENFRKWVTDALPFFQQQPAMKALDVGCATGYCLEVFKENGWTPYGIELDKGIAGDLRANGYSIYDTPLVTLQTAEKFNVITLFDVIEHLTDLQENMAKLQSLLADDGIVVMVTPDFGSWQRRIFGKRWFQFKPIEHIQYFSLSTLKKLATANGFELIHHKRSGQFCDMAFLENRLRKYRFRQLLPLFRYTTALLRLRTKLFYTDTASLYVILKKKVSAA